MRSSPVALFWLLELSQSLPRLPFCLSPFESRCERDWISEATFRLLATIDGRATPNTRVALPDGSQLGHPFAALAPNAACLTGFAFMNPELPGLATKGSSVLLSACCNEDQFSSFANRTQ